MATKFFRLFESPTSAPWSVTASLCYYTRLYGLQLVLVTLLSAVTVYRREMSCNRVYTAEEDDISGAKRCRKEGEEDDDSGSNKWEESAEELLEGAGAYCSGEPLMPVVLKLCASIFFESLKEGNRSLASHSVIASHPSHESAHATDGISRDLPADVQVHLLSYLHPKDVVTFACTSRSSLAIVDRGETSRALWKSLWLRDYAWAVHSWTPGIDALRRSQPTQQARDKKFYFMFGESFIDYILAGQNTFDQCLVGLHGHIYDITAFLHTHPGSPETLMVQAGKDATKFFEDMRHSTGARRLAQSLCVVVNNFCFEDECGLRPTLQTFTSDHQDVPTVVEAPTVPTTRTKEPRNAGTLQSIRSDFNKQEQEKVIQVTSRFASNPNVLSHVNVFYDPFRREWKGWYTNVQFETVYIEKI